MWQKQILPLFGCEAEYVQKQSLQNLYIRNKAISNESKTKVEAVNKSVCQSTTHFNSIWFTLQKSHAFEVIDFILIVSCSIVHYVKLDDISRQSWPLFVK